MMKDKINELILIGVHSIMHLVNYNALDLINVMSLLCVCVCVCVHGESQ